MIRKTALLTIGLFATLHTFAQSTQDFEQYIDKYKEIAIAEMQRAGIPASIKLGQALLESDAGRSDLARKANNHFGIKCNNDWDGKTFKKKDDDYDAQGEHIQSCFRVYEDAEASFRAHSEFLRNPKKQFRYGILFELDPTDYKGWADGLRKAGYATNPSYSKKLVDVIEKYQLYKYDYMTIADNNRPNPSSGTNSSADMGGYMVANDVKYVLSRDNEPVEEIAKRTHTPLRSIVAYNENLKGGTQRLMKDSRVYLQPKRNSYRGKETYHTVQVGETMFEIAQEYGLKLEKMYDRNQMNPGMEPAYNEQIKLKGGRVSNRPKLISEVPPPILLPPPAKDTIVTVAPPTTPSVVKTEPAKTPPVSITPIKNPSVATVEDKEEGTLPEISPEKPGNGNSTNYPSAEKPAQTSTNSNTKPTVSKPTPDINTGGVMTTKPESSRDDFDASDVFAEPKPETPVTQPNESLQYHNTYHTVAKGDTLWNVSQRYNMTVSEVKRLNNLNSDGIQLGMRLRVK